MAGRRTTTFYYYRCYDAHPPVDGKRLASFVDEFIDIGLTSGRGLSAAGVFNCFAEDLEDTLQVYLSGAGDKKGGVIYTLSGLGRKEFVEYLSKNGSVIGRVSVNLGPLPSALSANLSRALADSIVFNSWGLSIDRIAIGKDGEMPQEVSLMALSMYGNNNCGPYTPKKIIDEFWLHEPIRMAMALCHQYWPVWPQSVTQSIIDQRIKLCDCWPYEKIDEPYGWYWGPLEDNYW